MLSKHLFITDKYGIKGGNKQAIIDDRQIRLGGDVIISIDNTPVRKIDDTGGSRNYFHNG